MSEITFVNSPLTLLHIFFFNWLQEFDVIDQDNFYLISLSIFITCLLNNVRIREKLYVNHFWELKGLKHIFKALAHHSKLGLISFEPPFGP